MEFTPEQAPASSYRSCQTAGRNCTPGRRWSWPLRWWSASPVGFAQQSWPWEFPPEQAAEAAKGAGIDLAAEKFDAKALALGMTAELCISCWICPAIVALLSPFSRPADTIRLISFWVVWVSIPIDATFPNGCRFPCDPDCGKPEEVVNCHLKEKFLYSVLTPCRFTPLAMEASHAFRPRPGA